MSTKAYTSKCRFDANLFSEPLAVMNMLVEFEQLERNKEKWCWQNALVAVS